MQEKINCPFCNFEFEKGAKQCPSCKSFFEEPSLPNIKLQEFGWFFTLHIITKGWFGIIWFLMNISAINKMSTNSKDKLKLNWLLIILLTSVCAYMYLWNKISPWIISIVAFIIFYFVYVALSYRVLRIIQKYTQKFYSVDIEINPYYIALFNIFYLIHFIDTYSDRVLQTHEHFDMKWPYLVMLIFILLFAPIALFMFNPPLYGLWIFFKSLI